MVHNRKRHKRQRHTQQIEDQRRGIAQRILYQRKRRAPHHHHAQQQQVRERRITHPPHKSSPLIFFSPLLFLLSFPQGICFFILPQPHRPSHRSPPSAAPLYAAAPAASPS